MRTKTLLLTAALSAAGVAASMAQVYSVNVVGYVNITIPASGWAILNNPLNNGDNKLQTILQMPSGASAVMFIWDGDAQNFLDSLTYIEGLGWLTAGNDNPVLAPGAGFFIQNAGTDPLTLTFVGEVQQGASSTTLKNNGKWSMVGSKVPQAAKLSVATDTAGLQFPATDGDLVFVWDIPTQNYLDSFTFIGGLGWLSAADPTGFDGPNIPVANGFWIQRNASTGPNWDRTFNVQ